MLENWSSVGQKLASVGNFSNKLFLNVSPQPSLYKGFCWLLSFPVRYQIHCKLCNDFETAQMTFTLSLPQCAVIVKRTALISCTVFDMHCELYFVLLEFHILCWSSGNIPKLISLFYKVWTLMSQVWKCV